MERPKSEHMFGMMLESFHDLPSWKQIAIVACTVVLSPWLLFVGALVLLALSPMVLFGQLAGDMGRAPLRRKLSGIAKRAVHRTELFYA